jgi:hypothetical protein
MAKQLASCPALLLVEAEHVADQIHGVWRDMRPVVLVEIVASLREGDRQGEREGEETRREREETSLIFLNNFF